MMDRLEDLGYEIRSVSHAAAILEMDFSEALVELESSLVDFEIPITEIIGSGGGETKGTQRLRRALDGLGWRKTTFEIRKTINGEEKESTSHEVDHVKRFAQSGVLALEIEWNNKDPFFDRDLENFKRLHAEGAISVGIIVTRGASLQDSMLEIINRFTTERRINSYDDLERIGLEPTAKQKASVMKQVTRAKKPLTFPDAWARNFVSNKFGQAQTHWRKLIDRIDRGVGNPCPLLLIGMPASIVTFDLSARIEMQEVADDNNDAEDE